MKDIRTIHVEVQSKEESQNTNSGFVTSKRLVTVHLENGKTLELNEIRTIKCKKMVYIWDPKDKLFYRMVGLDQGMLNSDLHLQNGMTKEEQNSKRTIYGSNEINIPVQGILTLFVLEALTPFYIFQVFSVLLWVAENYLYYGIAIVIMSIYGISSSIIQTRTNQRNLKGTVFTEDTVTVCRGSNFFEDIKTSELVPGDLIAIPSEGCKMQCDAVLLKGNCIVNESLLTGESVPVHKTSLANDNNYYRVTEDSNNTLFSGTTVLQTKFCGNRETLALVLRTGYLTTKGELVRSMLYPPPADFKFDQDSYKFIGILVVIAMLGFFYTVVTKLSRKLPFIDIAIKALDLVTIAIPPALPIAMTVGKLYAIDRLKKNNIYCINSKVINVSGSVDCVCFDKTGTLTEDELDMWGVLPVNNNKFDLPIKDIASMRVEIPLYKGMLTCHSLSIIDGKLCGYPLDLKMFNSTTWIYKKYCNDDSKGKLLIPEAIVYPNHPITDNSTYDIQIYAQFPFISSLQRTSVICKDSSEGSCFEIFCKGSPEAIVMLSNPKTVPDDIFLKLKMFTTKGYRVIAMGTRTLNVEESEVPKFSREDIEKDLIFSGLIILENRLKVQTAGTIKTLKNAGVKIKMITGDNIQTAVSVGKECGIVDKNSSIVEVLVTNSLKEGPKIRYNSFDRDSYKVSKSIREGYFHEMRDVEIICKKYQFVVTGNSWANIIEHFPRSIPHIIKKGIVFARMSSHQKQQLIEELKNIGYYVAMCGDGANDCAALKAAHLGISLSEAEASIAAPFTSKQHNISCVSMVIREGRAALLTSFGVFKFIVCGSLAEFFCTVILYGIDCNLSSMQFLFMDIFLQLNLATFFGNTEACEKLHHKAPLNSILSFVPLMSMTLFMLLSVGFQIFAFYFIRTFSWYKPFSYVSHVTDISMCQENFSTFVISMFQYITMAIVFSKGKPYRQPLYTNKKFTSVLIVTTLICIYITLIPPSWVVQALEINLPTDLDIRIQLLIMASVNLILALLLEEVIVDLIIGKMIYPRFKHYHKSIKYEKNVDVVDFPNKKTVIKNVNECKNDVKLNDKLSKEDKYIVTRC